MKNRDITDDSVDYQNVTNAFVECFVLVELPEDMVWEVMAAPLSFADLNKSLRHLNSLHKKTGFNIEAKFDLLRHDEIKHLELEQLAIYRVEKTFKILFDTFMELWSGRNAFQPAAHFLSSSRYFTPENSQGVCGRRDGVGSQRVLMQSKASLFPPEANVDVFAGHLAKRSLTIKNNHSQDEMMPYRLAYDRTCS